MGEFEEIVIQHIRMEENTRVDMLSNLASGGKKKGLDTVIQQILPRPTVVTKECLNTDVGPQDWLSTVKRVRPRCQKGHTGSMFETKSIKIYVNRQDLYK